MTIQRMTVRRARGLRSPPMAAASSRRANFLGFPENRRRTCAVWLRCRDGGRHADDSVSAALSQASPHERLRSDQW